MQETRGYQPKGDGLDLNNPPGQGDAVKKSPADRVIQNMMNETEKVKPEIANRFTYHAPKEGKPEKYEDLRALGLLLAHLIDRFCPDSREKSTAISKVDEAIMWANAAIARNE